MKRLRGILCVSIFLLLGIYPVFGQTIERSLFPDVIGLEGYVNADNVNVRQYPAINGHIMDQAHYEEVKVIGKNDKWYKVLFKEEEAWIYEAYVEVPRETLIPYVKVKGEEIVEFSMQFIGTPYVWGGDDLENGVDCSGFTQSVFDVFGIDISRVSYMQAEDGLTISKDELRIGDLVFFDTLGTNDGRISHVGIYIGEGRFIHSDGTKGVMVSHLSNSYYTRNYVKSVRVY